MEALLEFYSELVAENGKTVEIRRAAEVRDEKEKAEIAATKQTLISWYARHMPGAPLPPIIADVQQLAPQLGSGNDAIERARQSLAAAFEQMPVRFTTKDFFPLVPEIQAEEVPDSQGYDFLRRLIEEEKLWIYQQGAGRRATTYSKVPVVPVLRSSVTYGGALEVPVLTESILKAVQPLPNLAALPPKPEGIR